jgi:carbonic anhydrase
MPDRPVVTARDALERLRAGNRRFVEGGRRAEAYLTEQRRAELTRRQDPFAIILGCSDSRVPAEIVFDQGVGDLFVIRVAGNIIAPSLVGSVEFAAQYLGTPLVVVLGHSQCGAITATIDELQRPTMMQSRNIQAIVDQIRPSVDAVFDSELQRNRAALVEHVVRANIRVSVDHLRHDSDVIEKLIRDKGFAVVGAEYSLETGLVEFFDDVPAGAR